MKKTMKGNEAISAKLAECYITIEGKRYNFLQIKDFEAKMNVDIADISILGRLGKAHKATGWDGEWSGTAHFNQSIMRMLFKKYKDTGIFEYFKIQVSNEDPSTTLGRQTIILEECLMDGSILTLFDADGDSLEEDISGTFDNWDMPDTFTTLEGMKV